MSEEIPDTVEKGIKSWLAAGAFTLVLVGGDVMKESRGEGIGFWIGGLLVILALPVYLSAAWWQVIKPKMDRRALEYLTAFSQRIPWWGRSLAFVLLAVGLAQIFPKLQFGPQPQIPPTTIEHPPINLPSQARPEYLKNITFGVDEGDQPTSVGGFATITIDRLRVAVDYSFYKSGWLPKRRIFIGELKEPMTGVQVRLPIITSGLRPDRGSSDLWWANSDDPIYPPDPTDLVPVVPYRCRLVIIGPAGEEQHYYFSMLRVISQQGKRRFGILRGPETNWVENWEK